jgi:DNA-binding MarR family transcriptional regulator
MARNNALDDPLVTTFGRLLEATHHLEDLLGRNLAATVDLPLTWFEVLLRLSRSNDGELTMGELSEQLALTTGGVTRLIDRMSTAGYVERRPCETDRRVLFTAITDAGRAVLTPALRGHVASLREVFAGFSTTELSRFDRLLDRLRSAS